MAVEMTVADKNVFVIVDITGISVGHREVVGGRIVLIAFCDGHRQLARRGNLAAEDIGHAVARLLTVHPCMEDRIRLVAPAHIHDIAHIQQDDHFLACLVERFTEKVDVRLLGFREIPVARGEGAVPAFARHAADAVDADVITLSRRFRILPADGRFLDGGDDPKVLCRLLGLLLFHIVPIGFRKLLVQLESCGLQSFIDSHFVGAVHITGAGASDHRVIGRHTEEGHFAFSA